VALARDDGVPFHDAMIVAAAAESGCEVLWSEDLQRGRQFVA